MPPKKKQEEIDLSTLPECKSINICFYSKGRKTRATQIVSKIQSKYEKTMFHVSKSAVLEYAKQKGIYVDPDSLTDKQKKDPKFMETVCTQLTPEVLGKATDAYINNQNVKIRLEKKANDQKPQEEQEKNPNQFDCIYVFDDFPTQTQQYEGLAQNNQNLSFVIVMNPKISWTSAPEEPDPEDEDPEQPDEEIIEFRKLQEQEILKEEDNEHNTIIESNVKEIIMARRKSSQGSLFRNTVIDYLPIIINPYEEENSQNQAVNKFTERINQLITEGVDFKQWIKDKEPIKYYKLDQEKPVPEVQQGQKQEEQQKEEDNKKAQPKEEQQTIHASGNCTLEILNNLVNQIYHGHAGENQQEEEMDFQNYNFAAPIEQIHVESSAKPLETGVKHIDTNESSKQNDRKQLADVLKQIKLPGIDRFMVPEVPPKSEKLRKAHRSTFGQFLPQNLHFHDFEKKLDTLTLESAAKEIDEQRDYNFGNRLYEEHHDHSSLVRQINSALLFDESTLGLKYNENNDKLYMVLLYKNGQRRVHRKYWENNWKVLPNFESWLKYFKDNDTNLQNAQYYDIDYERIGNIQEDAQIYSTKQGGAIVHKKAIAGNQETNLLYCLLSGRNNEIFGVRKNEFYCENQRVKILQKKTIKSNDQPCFRSYLTFKDKTIIQLAENGDIYIHKSNQPVRLITKEGYTIIYDTQSTVLHPRGGISHPPHQFINQFGYGKADARLKEIQSLKRSTDGCSFIKRDDNTVIVNQNAQKWIKFPDQTEYLLDNSNISIEKVGFPFITINTSQNQTIIKYEGVTIKSLISSETQCRQIQLDKGYHIDLQQKQISLLCNNEPYPYICNIQENSIKQQWQNECLKVFLDGKSQYKKGNRTLNPMEDQENYDQQEILPQDYIDPRLFIINNDNTGYQLLNQKQLQNTFMVNFPNNNQQNQLYRNAINNKETMHGLVNIPTSQELNKRMVNPKFNINQDVFRYCEREYNHQKTEALKVRSFIRNPQLTAEDRKKIAEIMNQQSEWVKQSQKQNNEYGNKPRNDPSTAERYLSSKKTIQYRLLQETPNLYNELKTTAIQMSESCKRQKKLISDKQAQQEEMRKRMSRKKSYQSNYPPIYFREKMRDQNQVYYSTEGSFYSSYWETVEGKKALSQMPDWVFRPKQIRKPQQLDPEIVSELHNTMNRTKKSQDDAIMEEKEEKNERYDTVEVNIEPQQQIYIKPSVFTQREIDEERTAFESEKKAYQYHEAKRKEFDVYGNQRRDKSEVPSLMRTQPVSQLNQKYLVTEAPVDKKIKISSMKNKLTSLASNMTEMRKQGPHASLIKTLDKRNQYSKLLEKRTMMIQADLNDNLQRDVLINPIQANFGYLKEGFCYQLKIVIKNQDVLSQRIMLKRPKSIFSKAYMRDMGPIALGMTRNVCVTLKASPEINGRFTDEFDITTKHQIYHIPITAHILTAVQYENGRHLLAKGVRQVADEPRKRKTEELPPIN